MLILLGARIGTDGWRADVWLHAELAYLEVTMTRRIDSRVVTNRWRLLPQVRVDRDEVLVIAAMLLLDAGAGALTSTGHLLELGVELVVKGLGLIERVVLSSGSGCVGMRP